MYSYECKHSTNPLLDFAQTPHSDLCAQLAQLVEQRTENPRVSGSIPELGIIAILGAKESVDCVDTLAHNAGVVQW